MINFYSIDETLDLLAKDEALIIPQCDSAIIGTYTLERGWLIVSPSSLAKIVNQVKTLLNKRWNG